MGNASSIPSVQSTHAVNHSSPAFNETHQPFSVSPFERSTLLSITKVPSKSSSCEPSPTVQTHTEEYCSWDWMEGTSSCSSWVFTVDIPTPFTSPTPTRGYQTTETAYSFPYYTCTDFLCIDSVVSDYGYALCLATSTMNSWFPTETWSWPEESTTERWPTATPTCDPLLDWKNCPSPTPEPWETISDPWPATTFDSDPWSMETSSDCDTTTTSSSSTGDCEFGIRCWTSLDFTTLRSQTTRSTSVSKHSYSYHSSSSTSSSTRRMRTSTTTSDCNFWDDDCIPTVTGRYTSEEWEPTPLGGGHAPPTTPNALR